MRSANKQGKKESSLRRLYVFFALGEKFTQGIKAKKLIYIAIFLQLSISSLLLAQDPNVYFADPNLQEAVADALELTPPITESEMENLLSLTANSMGISDLTGLGYATGLIKLNLNNNQITDISALAYTPDVNELHLSGNLISDLSPISALTSLIYLYLNDNQITDISAVENLVNLDTLFLSANDVNDISPVSGLTGLTGLYLNDNQITDISAVSSLVNLDTLFLSTNDVNDISPVSGLTGLTGLYLMDNEITADDFSSLDLSGLLNLTALDLTGNEIEDISVVLDLTSLEELYLANNQIENIGDMSSLTSLQYLHLTNNEIEDIDGLIGEEPNDLSSLLLGGNPLNQVSYCTYLGRIADNNPLLSLGDIEVDDDLHNCLPHDICNNAIEVFKNVLYEGTTVGATGAEEESICGVDDWKDVWHYYTPDSNEVVNVDLCGSSLDTSLVVFDSCPGTGGTVLACNDDYNGSGCGVQSLVTVELTGGQTYMIRVAGYSAPTNGTGPYTLIIENAPAPPANNICDDAIEIFQYDDPITGSTVLAYGTDITSCTASDTRDVWYYFSPTISGLYLIDPVDPEGGDYDATLAVFDGCGGNELTCNDLYCNYNYWGYCDVYKSRIIVSLDAAQTYYIRVSGYAGRGGNYSLTVTLAPDINKDGVVDIFDLMWLAGEWMQDGTSYADIGPEETDGGDDGGGDKFIDVLDFAELGKQWREITNP